MTYTARYAHGDSGIPGDLTLAATSDPEAIAEVDALVADGYRNGTWATIELADGTVYRARNEHGRVVATRS